MDVLINSLGIASQSTIYHKVSITKYYKVLSFLHKVLSKYYHFIGQLYPDKAAEKKKEWSDIFVNSTLSKGWAEKVIKFLILNLIFLSK